MRCSGKFVLRVHPVLHARLRKKSREWAASLNETCLRLITSGLNKNDHEQDRFLPILRKLKNEFKSGLWGVLVFGSWVKKQEFASSDVDLLILLDQKIVLSRSLYQIWDEAMDDHSPPIINPHFVHLPKGKEFGSLWLEVVKNHHILFDKKSSLQNILDQIHGYVMMGQVSQKISHGQPYWIRS